MEGKEREMVCDFKAMMFTGTTRQMHIWTNYDNMHKTDTSSHQTKILA